MSMYRFINVLVLIVCCTACSSTTVHLYAKYLTADETQRLVKGLSDSFNVQVNTLDIPNNIEQSTMIYSPLMANKKDVDGLETTLAQLNWPEVDKVTLFQSNHWYTKNTIGVMLLPEKYSGNKARLTAKLAQQFNGEQCKLGTTLVLNDNGQYQVFNEQSLTAIYEGTWRYQQPPYLELSSDDPVWWRYFEVQEQVVQDIVGELDMIALIALDKYQLLGSCNFSAGVRR